MFRTVTLNAQFSKAYIYRTAARIGFKLGMYKNWDIYDFMMMPSCHHVSRDILKGQTYNSIAKRCMSLIELKVCMYLKCEALCVNKEKPYVLLFKQTYMSSFFLFFFFFFFFLSSNPIDFVHSFSGPHFGHF